MRADNRPRATAAMLSVMGCISSSTPDGRRPMLIANTGLNYRVFVRDGLESRTVGALCWPNLPIVPLASCPRESAVRAFLGGIYGI